MAKKNQQLIKQIHDAVAKIKEILSQDSGVNPKFSESLEIAERHLLDQLFEEVSRGISRPTT
jgi:hypothetical protein